MFEAKYANLAEMTMPNIANMTGCLAPCDYKEYKLSGEPVSVVSLRRKVNVSTKYINLKTHYQINL